MGRDRRRRAPTRPRREGDGFRAFDEGDVVDFDYVPAVQGSFRFVATRARLIAPAPR
jgi:hypothetical protein